ncbi:MAG: hypothetical protein ABI651_19220, partial [Verrucomicrobiota bacterium]
MNSDSPHSSREELEARLTALLLGELSAAEAAAMRRAIDQDAQLAQLYERLERTINLVHEAAASPIEPAAVPSTMLKMSEGNRQRLLQSFKTAAPKEFTAPHRREMPWFIPMSIAAVVIAMIGSAALLPGFWSRSKSAKNPLATARLSHRDRARSSESEMRLDSSFQKDIVRPKLAKSVVLPHEQSESGVTIGTASDVASATTSFGGSSRGGGAGGGKPPVGDSNFSFWRTDSTATAATVAGGALALGYATPLGSLFETKKNIAAGQEEKAAETIPQPIVPQTSANDFSQAEIAGRRAGAATEKIDSLGVSGPAASRVPQVGDLLDYGLPPLALIHPPISPELQRDSGVVTASREAESLKPGLAVPLVQGAGGRQLDEPQSEIRNVQTTSASSKPSLQKEDKLSEFPTLELSRNADVNGGQSSLANRSEDLAGLKMDSRMMRRYGLSTLGAAESKSKAATTVDEKAQSRQQSIVLPQRPSDEAENRHLRESGRSAKGTTVPETVLALQEKKRELEGLVELRDGLTMKPNAERIDAVPPKSSIVQIVDLAQAGPEKKPSLVERLRRGVTGKIEKVARIEVRKDVADVDDMGGKRLGAFDPFFIQTEFEVIHSASVLSKV